MNIIFLCFENTVHLCLYLCSYKRQSLHLLFSITFFRFNLSHFKVLLEKVMPPPMEAFTEKKKSQHNSFLPCVLYVRCFQSILKPKSPILDIYLQLLSGLQNHILPANGSLPNSKFYFKYLSSF